MLELPLEYYAYSSLLNCVICSAISIAVLYKRPRSGAAITFSSFNILIAAWAFLYFLWLRITDDSEKAEVLVRTCMIFVVLMPPVFLHFAVLLIKENKSLPVLIPSYSLAILIALSVYTPLFSPGTSHFLVFPFWPLPGPTFFLHLAQMMISITFGLWLIANRARKATGLDRIQLWWIFWAFFIVWFTAYANYTMWFRIPIPPVLNPLVCFFVLIVAYGIVKHQLMDISVVIRKSLIYSLLIAAITATYLVAVLVIERLFQGVFGYESVVATVIVAFLISIFFNPVRNRIQTFVDRSLFKATTAELAEQREKLLLEVRKSEQQKAVATLAAGMAHEIKNPLTAIKTFTEHLPERFDSEEFRNKFNRIVGGEVERINHIVQQLLDFSKPVPPKLQPVQINNILDETLEFLNNDLIERHIKVTKNYDEASTVRGDPQQLKQVFLNLFLNSLQAMDAEFLEPHTVSVTNSGNGFRPCPAEGRTGVRRSGKLNITTTQADSNLTVTIQDNGEGMSRETLEHLFEPFYTTKSSGTGLGLSVVKGIVEEHQGSVKVMSRKGEGASVRIEIPVSE